MRFITIFTLAFGLAAKLATGHPTGADAYDPMPIGNDLLWECKDPAQPGFDDCQAVRDMILDKGGNDGSYTPELQGCEAFESGNCRLTLCPEIENISYFMPDIAFIQLYFLAGMCGLHGHRGWIAPTNGTYNLWFSEAGWTGFD